MKPTDEDYCHVEGWRRCTRRKAVLAGREIGLGDAAFVLTVFVSGLLHPHRASWASTVYLPPGLIVTTLVLPFARTLVMKPELPATQYQLSAFQQVVFAGKAFPDVGHTV